ncbi:hypothetical protein [Chromobacterium violaceum]|uniref:Uncharacterized protein n=1 Tax=Chromobacterium violaceum TaxID=536 RepID=A0A202BAQ1_CHRVL|nr:hypothetical protein [Chromobacterium violaceum]OVE48558.1 hypothetical protein CBW21_08305 [Chromobacterium violaceum]
MLLNELPRDLACHLNPLIGSSTSDTMQNLIHLLDGQCSLISDRAPDIRLDGEMVHQFLKFVGGAVRFEASNAQDGRFTP